MIAPEAFDAGVYSLLQGPDHFGTSLPVLLAWLIVDRAQRDPGGHLPGGSVVVPSWSRMQLACTGSRT